MIRASDLILIKLLGNGQDNPNKMILAGLCNCIDFRDRFSKCIYRHEAMSQQFSPTCTCWWANSYVVQLSIPIIWRYGTSEIGGTLHCTDG